MTTHGTDENRCVRCGCYFVRPPCPHDFDPTTCYLCLSLTDEEREEIGCKSGENYEQKDNGGAYRSAVRRLEE